MRLNKICSETNWNHLRYEAYPRISLLVRPSYNIAYSDRYVCLSACRVVHCALWPNVTIRLEYAISRIGMWGRQFHWCNFRWIKLEREYNLTLNLRPSGDRLSKTLHWHVLGSDGWAFDQWNFSLGFFVVSVSIYFSSSIFSFIFKQTSVCTL